MINDKRQGRSAMGCVGGAMIGLDLSRAFDKLPRWALQASLEHASVDQAVCKAVIAIHERCMYTIKHGPHEDRIAMRPWNWAGMFFIAQSLFYLHHLVL